MKNNVAIHESKNSETVVKYVDLTVEALSQYCSRIYAKTIIKGHNNGSLYGVYFTKSGKIKATFI